MKQFPLPLATFVLAATTVAFGQETPPPVVYTGDTHVTNTADGGLRPIVGVHNIGVHRANRTASEHLDGLPDTYQHAPMLCFWSGRFWLEYLSGPRSEHEPPCATSIMSSVDGLNWTAPTILFPSIPLPGDTHSLAHQRMGFYVAPDSRLLALGFYGKEPAPNDGTGIGRAVREIHPDGSFGPIYFIRLNAVQPFPGFELPFALYSTSPDTGFVAACDALLSNKLMTAQWWEEDQLDETNFYRIRGKATSYVTRPDGSVLGIWKNRIVATTNDRGESWQNKSFGAHLPNNGSKYWLQRTADQHYGLVLNPTNRNRYPLAIMTSADSETFTEMFAVHGELPDQRFGGYLKNMGPQYVRGIVEGNGTPPDAARAFYLTYSVNKEDIWFARVPTPLTAAVTGSINDSFNDVAIGSLPETWNIYSPSWAPVRIVPTANVTDPTQHALELRDEDPYDYARAIRVFPTTHGVKISFRVFAQQTTARLEIDLLNAVGDRPVRLAFAEDGHLWACHEAQWMDAGPYTAGQWHTMTLEIPPAETADRCAITVDGTDPLPRPAFFTDPVTSVERISFRTGPFRERGYGGRDLPGADVKAPLAVFQIDDVTIEPVP